MGRGATGRLPAGKVQVLAHHRQVEQGGVVHARVVAGVLGGVHQGRLDVGDVPHAKDVPKLVHEHFLCVGGVYPRRVDLYLVATKLSPCEDTATVTVAR